MDHRELRRDHEEAAALRGRANAIHRERMRTERVERAQKFFAERKVEGTERSMARVAEQVTECATLRAREMDAVMKYLAVH